ncbi:protein takeout [Drosophila ficusphila]|uniref:protein takeout n=1 Tax=Drosophila ficusphila TaxID=30025 RepID=UPI0007E7CD88|nr:protein takeout [Drosophila ficusphila]
MSSTRPSRRSFSIWSGFVAMLCLNEFAFDKSVVSAVEYYTEKPAFLPSCRIYEPGFTKCSTNSIQKLLDQLNIGIPEVVERFGPFDPMRVRDIVFKQDNNEVATIRANLTELVVKGFSKTKVKESRVSKKDFGWQTKIFLPKMRLDGKYEMAGRILLIPLSGSGKIFIEIDDLDILLLTKTRLYEKGGFTFDNVTSVRVQLNLTKVRTYLDNLFNGRSKEVERSTNQFFNENWRDFYEALKPLIVETVENILYDVMSTVFHLIPANFFVEDIPTPQQLYGPKTAVGKRNS